MLASIRHETLGGERHGAAQPQHLAQVAGTEEQGFRRERDQQPQPKQREPKFGVWNGCDQVALPSGNAVEDARPDKLGGMAPSRLPSALQARSTLDGTRDGSQFCTVSSPKLTAVASSAARMGAV